MKLRVSDLVCGVQCNGDGKRGTRPKSSRKSSPPQNGELSLARGLLLLENNSITLTAENKRDQRRAKPNERESKREWMLQK